MYVHIVMDLLIGNAMLHFTVCRMPFFGNMAAPAIRMLPPSITVEQPLCTGIN